MRSKIIPKILLIISLISLLVLWPIVLLTSNSYIWYLLQKSIPLNSDEVKSYDKQVISFFNGDIKELSFLSADEFSHIQDVKNILTVVDLIFWPLLVVFSLSVFYLRKSIKNILKKVSIFVFSFLILLLILSLFNFDSFFKKFHEVFFADNYAFPSISMLKVLFPDSFFRDMFILYFILSILGCLIVIGISFKLKVKKV